MSQGLRARKKEQTHGAIVAAALDLFEAKGYDATTIEDIAEASNVSSRTFFRYFDSKLDVVFPGKSDDEPLMAECLDARPSEEGPVEAAHHVIREMLAEMLAGDDDTTMRQLRVVMANPSLRALAVEHSQQHRGELVPAFAKRMHASPEDVGPHVLAAAVAEAIWVIVERWVAAGATPRSLGAMVDETFTLLQKGFG